MRLNHFWDSSKQLGLLSPPTYESFPKFCTFPGLFSEFFSSVLACGNCRHWTSTQVFQLHSHKYPVCKSRRTYLYILFSAPSVHQRISFASQPLSCTAHSHWIGYLSYYISMNLYDWDTLFCNLDFLIFLTTHRITEWYNHLFWKGSHRPSSFNPSAVHRVTTHYIRHQIRVPRAPIQPGLIFHWFLSFSHCR